MPTSRDANTRPFIPQRLTSGFGAFSPPTFSGVMRKECIEARAARCFAYTPMGLTVPRVHQLTRRFVAAAYNAGRRFGTTILSRASRLPPRPTGHYLLCNTRCLSSYEFCRAPRVSATPATPATLMMARGRLPRQHALHMPADI